MTRHPITFELNGRPATAEVGPRRMLLDLLRDEMRLNGPKYGCGKAQCGSCTVLVDGCAARSCVLRAARIHGARVTTLEGLARDGRRHPVQDAFIETQGAQCGYCLNGMVMTAVALLDAEPDPSPARIRAALRDNMCRCGAHQEILEAVALAARRMAEAQEGTDG